MFHKTGGGTKDLSGYCKYFEVSGECAKLIPPHIINIGCRFYKDKDNFIQMVIEKFDGTFV
jgi:hypothetical protein